MKLYVSGVGVGVCSVGVFVVCLCFMFVVYVAVKSVRFPVWDWELWVNHRDLTLFRLLIGPI